MQIVFVLILTIAVIDIECTIRLSFIANATYISNDTIRLIKFTNSCLECICNVFFSNQSSPYVGLNCDSSNKTCALFSNYSSPSWMESDLNSTFIFSQLPPLQNTTRVFSLLNGVTVAGYGNGTAGSTNNSLKYPWGLAMDANKALYVADYNNFRVMAYQSGSVIGSIVAGTEILGSTTSQLHHPAKIFVDPVENIYISDDFNCRIMLWSTNVLFGIQVATNNGTSVGLAVDSFGNIYVSDYQNHIVMKWAPNATSGTLVAGTKGVHGNTNTLLHRPYGLYLNENNSYIYIADLNNHRIQRYRLDVSTNGTTVAGGNGQGSGNNQLNTPYAVCVSKKTGDIYVADFSNQRIQRWSSGATSGVTIIGINGVNGANATMLYGPASVMLDTNETFLYVSDRNNHRVQRFSLI